MKTAKDLDRKIFSLIARGAHQPCSEKEFSQLALEIFRYQFACNMPYQKFCRTYGLTPPHIQHWRDIPAVPTLAFKEAKLTTILARHRLAEFHSSGTTLLLRSQRARHSAQGRLRQAPSRSWRDFTLRLSPKESLATSRHFHCPMTLKLYEASVLAGFQAVAAVAGRRDRSIHNSAVADRYIFLTPPPREAPHSSLVHMMETVRRGFGGQYFVCDGRVRSDALTRALSRYAGEGTRVALLGTALAFAQFFDFLERRRLRLELPVGSLAMETGGFKGQRREISREEFYEQFRERLGLRRERIVSEYGMCELSSQFYASPCCHPESAAADEGSLSFVRHRAERETAEILRPETPSALGTQNDKSARERVFHGPPWARVLVVDPETGREAPDGQRGLIRVFDLANRGSVLAIQTEDVGKRRGKGFELLGRAPMAESRGCSLMVE